MSPSFRHEDLARAMTDIDSGTAVAAKIGAALATPVDLDTLKDSAFVLPDGFKVEVLTAERFEEGPRRKRGHASLADLDSLIAYVNAHKEPERTAIYVDPRAPRVTAVLDDHAVNSDGLGDASWGDHRASHDLIHPPEWLFWVNLDDDLMTQVEFAQHIEDGQKDIRDPDPSTMLQIASTFQARTEANFSKATRLDNGQLQVNYHEEVNAAAGSSGQLEIPQTFTLGLPVFEGGPLYPVVARLRYRCAGGKLRLGYRLERLQDVLRYALQGDQEDGVVPRLRKECEGVPVYLGTPLGGSRA